MIPAPSPELRACVVVPAHDEEELVGPCLEAIAGQRAISSSELEVILVLDDCSDGTAAAAAAVQTRHPGLVVHAIDGHGDGAGAARRLGMDLACERLHRVGRPGGLIASTDADTRVAADWVERQLAAVGAGAEAIGGDIHLDLGRSPLSAETVRRREVSLEARLAAIDGAAEHPHFAGASIGVTARVYRAVGGLEPLRSLEDEAFASRLEGAGITVHRRADVRVSTSARTDSRADRGLGTDLAVSEWAATRTWSAADFRTEDLLRVKTRSVSVILPCREVAGTVGTILDQLAPLRDAGLIDELIAIDADSADGTAAIAAEHGAVVHSESALMPEFGPTLGKGDAMWRAATAARGEILVFIDADSEDFRESFVTGLLGPMLTEPGLRLVKGAFRRPLRVGGSVVPDGGGRVTELVARPLLNLHFPALAGFAQPLAGEMAIDRHLFSRLSVPVGYGVEIAMLIDALRLCGLDALGQCDLGERQNRHQALGALGAMALEVMVAAQGRTPGGRGTEPHPSKIVAAAPGGDISSRPVRCEERPPLSSLGAPALAKLPEWPGSRSEESAPSSPRSTTPTPTATS